MNRIASNSDCPSIPCNEKTWVYVGLVPPGFLRQYLEEGFGAFVAVVRCICGSPPGVMMADTLSFNAKIGLVDF